MYNTDAKTDPMDDQKKRKIDLQIEFLELTNYKLKLEICNLEYQCGMPHAMTPPKLGKIYNLHSESLQKSYDILGEAARCLIETDYNRI